jgi:RNA-directed DNA polymerase
MIKTPISLQDLRRSLYVKAKAEPTWRFWGLYVHVCKMETLEQAYRMAKNNDGAPGIDGITFAAIEESGRESFLKQIQGELVRHTYQPKRVRKKEIPKDGCTKVRVLSIPTIRDRVVQGALKLILEPIFEADFQSGSYGYRLKRTAQEAVLRVDQAIMKEKTRVRPLRRRPGGGFRKPNGSRAIPGSTGLRGSISTAASETAAVMSESGMRVDGCLHSEPKPVLEYAQSVQVLW